MVPNPSFSLSILGVHIMGEGREKKNRRRERRGGKRKGRVSCSLSFSTMSAKGSERGKVKRKGKGV